MAFYWEGLHPAFALVPIVPFLRHEPRRLDLFADPPDDDAVHHFEHEWNTAVQLILFLFGLVNAGVQLPGGFDTGTWTLLVAALVGRPVGILLAVGAAVAVGLHLPRRIGWREVVVIAVASSTGFTIALFFATGILSIGPMLSQLTVGALATSVGALLALGAGRLLRVGRFAS
jgi:NhaA family Na+:H+ antiporter